MVIIHIIFKPKKYMFESKKYYYESVIHKLQKII
jgi:hypothetical protein